MKTIATLGDHISTQKGYAFKSVWYTESGHPIVKVSDFTSDSVDPSNLICVPNEIALKHGRYSLSTGDVVIQTVGSWPSNPASVVGKTVRIPKKIGGALLNQNAVKVESDQSLDKGFLYYLLRSDEFKAYIVGTAQGAASQASITLDSIRAFKFTKPDLESQQKIAKTLAAYDNLIENNNRRIAILEEMAQSLYREWFVKFRFPGHEQAKFIDSPLGKIPEGWDVKRLGDLVDFKRESVKKGILSEPTPYMGLEHFPRKSLSLSEWDEVSEIGSSKLVFKRGDILFGKIRPYFHKVGVAQTDGICSSDTFVLEPINKKCHSLVAMVTFSDDFVAHSVQTSQGTKMPRANWGVLADYAVTMPEGRLLVKFNMAVDSAIDQLKILSAKNRNLKKQRNLLLPKLISGQINLSHSS